MSEWHKPYSDGWEQGGEAACEGRCGAERGTEENYIVPCNKATSLGTRTGIAQLRRFGVLEETKTPDIRERKRTVMPAHLHIYTRSIIRFRARAGTRIFFIYRVSA